MNTVLVRMEGIEKSFPGVHALSNCQFELHSGEIHALVGENGAGKSTLMKILSGVYKKDNGTIYIQGQQVEFHNTKQAQTHGISIIHQELNLMKHLTAAQNIFIGREHSQKIPFLVDEKTINEKTKQLFEMIHLDLDPRVKIAELTVAKQQMVEIAKALSYNMNVLIMDEPTSALSDSEIEDLFKVIRHLKEQGKGIVYITHRMEEIKQICDRVTVMRDGHYIATTPIKDITIEQIISQMVGREVYETVHSHGDTTQNEVVLEVKKLNQGNKVQDVSFKLHKGEILGFAGLLGAGRTETARAIFGADPKDSGEIYIKGKKVDIRHPKDAVKHGLGYLSEDRKQYGLALNLSVETNTVMASLEKFITPIGTVDTKKTKNIAQQFVERLKTKTPSIYQITKNLSGGNQQKVVISKWLARDCDILIFDEPTRGIDVGAKSEIYKLLNELADEGKSIIMISSELPEILRMSHRVLVMCEGKVTGILPAAECTQEKIMYYATMRN
ncbi:sugar ABC transporter ATP-binding protein [Gracilinema caldarium]|uniref:Monosaccharide-transporting ATPase n=1 Tax=Gracilinema caldarium (strain ATCC 51460 / DSM 7334 / H1) TaxID=744872 RepID=F8F0Y6_GRAC1|nr:ATP-binding cassette domain-containing protein [Gracilinema caldarium]AEJ20272.1 Monosaccharide-transporting ATPase [Gracilinema caldarium DSM 7334]